VAASPTRRREGNGFQAGASEVRERMRGLGFAHGEIAGELSRRNRLRPREAYRRAYGWSLTEAAARLNSLAAQEDLDPQEQASITANRLGEYERWAFAGRKPSVQEFVLLARLTKPASCRCWISPTTRSCRPLTGWWLSTQQS